MKKKKKIAKEVNRYTPDCKANYQAYSIYLFKKNQLTINK